MTSPLFNSIWDLPRSMRAMVQSSFCLSSSAIDTPSPWTNERTPYGPFVQVWMADLSPPPAVSVAKAKEGEASWREWQGFITRLRGTSGKLRCVDYYRMRPAYDERNKPNTATWDNGNTWADGSLWTQGALPPFVTLDEVAAAEDDSVVLRGLPADKADVLSPGDLMELRPNGVATDYGNLYEVIHCARSNAAGKARVYFQPGLRQGFNAGDMAVLREPTSVFRLADKDQGIVQRSIGNVGRLGLRLIEETRNG